MLSKSSSSGGVAEAVRVSDPSAAWCRPLFLVPSEYRFSSLGWKK